MPRPPFRVSAPAPPLDHIVTSIADDDVGSPRPDDVLDADNGVVVGPVGGKVHAHSGKSRGSKGDGVRTAAAHHKIGAAARDEQVVAAAAVKRVGAIATAQRIVAATTIQGGLAVAGDQVVAQGGADDRFDAAIGVALGITASASTGGQINVNATGRLGIIDRIVTLAAIDGIGGRTVVDDQIVTLAGVHRDIVIYPRIEIDDVVDRLAGLRWLLASLSAAAATRRSQCHGAKAQQERRQRHFSLP